MADTLSYESLAERLNTELEQAKASTAAVNELKPGQHKVASMIGDAGQLPTGMSPTKTIARGVAAGESFAAADYQYGQKNVLEILGQMTALKSKKDSAEQSLRDYNLAFNESQREAMDVGWKINADGSQTRMNDAEMAENDVYNDDPAVWLMGQKGGPQLLEGKTSVFAQKTMAESVKAAGGVEQYLTNVNRDALFNQKELTDIKAARDLSQVAVGFLRDFEGKNIPGVGVIQGRLWEVLTGKKGKQARIKLFTTINEKIRQISGAAVSEQEGERLQKQLSDAKSSDTLIRLALQQLSEATMIGEEMKKKSILNNISLDDAYKQYGKEAYEAAEFDVPDYLDKEDENTDRDYTNEFDNLWSEGDK